MAQKTYIDDLLERTKQGKTKTPLALNSLTQQEEPDPESQILQRDDIKPQNGESVDHNSVYEDILNQKANPDIEKIQQEAQQLNVDPRQYAFDRGLADISSSLGKAAVGQFEMVPGVDTSRVQKGFDTLPEEVKARYGAREDLRNQLLQRSKSLQEGDLAKRSKLLQDLQVKKQMESEPLTQAKQAAELRDIQAEGGPIKSTTKALLQRVTSDKNIEGLDLSQINEKDAQNLVSEISRLPNKESYAFQVVNTADGVSVVASNTKTGEVKKITSLGQKVRAADPSVIEAANANAKEVYGEGAPQLPNNSLPAEVENFNKQIKTKMGHEAIARGNITTLPSNTQNQIEWLEKQPQKTREAVSNVSRELNKDFTSINSFNSDMNTLKTLLADVKQGNAFAGQALKNRLPRVIGGEKGVLTDQDVNRLKGSQTYVDNLKRLFNEKINTGTALTDKDLVEIEATMKDMENVTKSNKNMFVEQRGNQLKSIIGQSADPNQLLLRQQSQQSPTTTDEKVTVVNPQGKRGKIPKSQLDAAIKQGFKLAE
jgi:hypothetical protein